MDLYNEKINEFVDWVDGKLRLYDSTSNQFVTFDYESKTDDKQVSGKSIRDLIQKNIQQPIYIWLDEPNRVYRVFSSKESFELWQLRDENPEYAKLEVANFAAVSKYVVSVNDNNGLPFSSSTKYVRYGDKTAQFSKFVAYWNITQDGASVESQVTVRYTVKNGNHSEQQTTIHNYIELDAEGKNGYINDNLYDLLHPGKNIVEVTITGTTTGAKLTVSYIIECMQLELDYSTFDYCSLKTANSSEMIDVKLTGVSSSSITIKAYFDGKDTVIGLTSISSLSGFSSARFPITYPSSVENGKHVLCVLANTTVESESNGSPVEVKSNCVFYELFFYIDEQNQTHALDIKTLVKTKSDNVPETEYGVIPTLYGVLYNLYKLYANVSSNVSINSTYSIRWYLINKKTNSETYITETNSQNHIESPSPITFDFYEYGEYTLVAKYTYGEGTTVICGQYDLNIAQETSFVVSNNDDYVFDFNNNTAKNNNTPKDCEWVSTSKLGVYKAVFPSNFPWSTACGWHTETTTDGTTILSLRLSNNQYFTINYDPFYATTDATLVENRGRVIEVQFKLTNVHDDNAVFAIFGDKENDNSSKIIFANNKCSIKTVNNTELTYTNYREGEILRIAFLINTLKNSGEADNAVVYILNNGILEKAAVYSESNAFSVNTSGRNIKFQANNCTLDVYNIRCYDQVLSYTNVFDNFAMASTDSAKILNKNNVNTGGSDSNSIDYEKTSTKIDTILINGPLKTLLAWCAEWSASDESKTKDIEIAADIQRICPSNPELNFIIKNARVRPHGQSNLRYPVLPLKIWSNSTFDAKNVESQSGNTYKATMYIGATKDSDCTTASPKGYYSLSGKGIPANKWVLQSNYADSSGVHNGSIQKLIYDTWTNAKDEQSNAFLQTPPQQVINNGYTGVRYEYKYKADLPEPDWDALDDNLKLLYKTNNSITDDAVAKEKYNTDNWTSLIDANNYTKLTKSYTNAQYTYKFPYEEGIRVSTDSFPCVVFYKDYNESSYKYLGQYVFMDDKKSELLYGQKSIYNDKNDPFNLTSKFSDSQKLRLQVWNNDSVLRIEVAGNNNAVVDYTEDLDLSPTYDANTGLFTGIAFLDNGRYFDLIYPDIDDLKLTTEKTENNCIQWNPVTQSNGTFSVKRDITTILDKKKFMQKIRPFIDWHKWLVDCYKLDNGALTKDITRQNSNYDTNSLGFNKFINEAKDHLDLYKMAAYYIFVVRFGLIDSAERNAQIKTYDGLHFWYEPWDMDIALGNNNNGRIAYDPPLTRNSISNGEIDENNMQEDSTIPAAIAGRTFNYLTGKIASSNWLWDCLEAWDEFKSIVKIVSDALTKNNFTYDYILRLFDNEFSDKWSEKLYNASGHFKYVENKKPNFLPWLQGARKSHRHWWLKKSFNYYDAQWNCGSFAQSTITLKTGGQVTIKAKPILDTYFGFGIGSGNVNLVNATVANGYTTIVENYSTTLGNPYSVYGANNMTEYIATPVNYFNISVKGCYDGISSALTTLIIPNTGDTSVLAAVEDTEDNDVFKRIEVLNLEGHNLQIFQQEGGVLQDAYSLKKFYAKNAITNSFASSNVGNSYEVLQLPSTITTLAFHNSEWVPYSNNGSEGLSFWKFENSEYKSQELPDNLQSLIYTGSTGKTVLSKELFFKWLDGKDSDAELNALNFSALNILWTDMYYEDVIKLSKLNGGGINATDRITGRIEMKTEKISGEPITDADIRYIGSIFKDPFNINGNNLVINCPLKDENGNNKIIVTLIAELGSEGCISYSNQTYTVIPGYKNNNYATPHLITLNATEFTLQENQQAVIWSLDDEAISAGFRINRVADIYSLSLPYPTHEIHTITLSASINSNTTIINLNVESPIYNNLTLENVYKQSGTVFNGVVKYTGLNIDSEGVLANVYVSNKLSHTISFEYDDTGFVVPLKEIKYTYDSNYMTVEGDSLIVTYTGDTIPDSSEEVIPKEVTATIEYVSGKKQTYKFNVYIVKDQVILTSTANGSLYSSFKSSNVPLNGNNYTEYSVKGHNNLTIDNVMSIYCNVDGTVYHPIEYCVDLTTLNVSSNSSTQQEIDITKLPKLQTVDLNASKINVACTSNNSIRTVKLGNPTYILFKNCSNLSSIDVQNNTSITKIDLENVRSFTAFAFLCANHSHLTQSTTVNNNAYENLTTELLDILATLSKKSNITLGGSVSCQSGGIYEDTYDILSQKLTIANANKIYLRLNSGFESFLVNLLLNDKKLDVDGDGKITQAEATAVNNFYGSFTNKTFDYDLDFSKFTSYKDPIYMSGTKKIFEFNYAKLNGHDIKLQNATNIIMEPITSLTCRKLIFGDLSKNKYELKGLLGDNCNIDVIEFHKLTQIDSDSNVHDQSFAKRDVLINREACNNTNIGLLYFPDLTHIGGVFLAPWGNDNNWTTLINTIIFGNEIEGLPESGSHFLDGFNIQNVIFTKLPTNVEAFLNMSFGNDSFRSVEAYGSESAKRTVNIYVPDELAGQIDTNNNWVSGGNSPHRSVLPLSVYKTNGTYKEYVN